MNNINEIIMVHNFKITATDCVNYTLNLNLPLLVA